MTFAHVPTKLNKKIKSLGLLVLRDFVMHLQGLEPWTH